jgi:hypothetical protein
MITIEKVNKLLIEIRKHSDLIKFNDESGEQFCAENNIKGGQLNFLVCVVQGERMKKENIKLKETILNKRNNGSNRNKKNR